MLALVAQGLTNAGVARRLVVSERTVEAHLRAVFLKLGITDNGDDRADETGIEQRRNGDLPAPTWQTHVVPITSNVGRAGIAGNVLLPAASSGLSKDSVAVPLGLELIDRSLLGQRAGRLPAVLMGEIDEGLRAVLGLPVS